MPVGYAAQYTFPKCALLCYSNFLNFLKLISVPSVIISVLFDIILSSLNNLRLEFLCYEIIKFNTLLVITIWNHVTIYKPKPYSFASLTCTISVDNPFIPFINLFSNCLFQSLVSCLSVLETYNHCLSSDVMNDKRCWWLLLCLSWFLWLWWRFWLSSKFWIPRQ